MTEREAQQRWCPMTQVIARSDVAGLTATGRDGTQNCIGSACMAWRWSADTLTRKSDDAGFCGLAGKP